MPEAALDGADLTSADLSPADVTGATLAGTDLTNARLSRTVGLTDAMLGDALGVNQHDLVEAVIDNRLRFEPVPVIQKLLTPVAVGKGVNGTAPYTGGPAFHPIVVLTRCAYAHAPWLATSGER